MTMSMSIVNSSSAKPLIPKQDQNKSTIYRPTRLHLKRRQLWKVICNSYSPNWWKVVS